jgi:Zn-dependent protease
MSKDYTVSFIQNRAQRKFTFSRLELRQILISGVILTIAFTLAMLGGIYRIPGEYYDNPEALLYLFLLMLALSAVAVFTAFFLHELAHKFTAQRYGCWAEFRYWPMGLLVALLFSAMGFLFAAPGAVMISGSMSKSQYGKISVAGPATNLTLAGIFALLWVFLDPNLLVLQDSSLVTLPVIVFFTLASINAFIGAFNLIPVPPFDGWKILKWRISVYISLLAIAVILVLLSWGFIPI